MCSTLRTFLQHIRVQVQGLPNFGHLGNKKTHVYTSLYTGCPVCLLKADIKLCARSFSVMISQFLFRLVKVNFFPTLKRNRPTSTDRFSDEATFHVCGTVSRQNCLIWVCENPLDVIESVIHGRSICGVRRWWTKL